MHGLDIENTALDPADGEIRLAQIYDGKEVILYDVQYSPGRAQQAVRVLQTAAAHNAPFEARWLTEKLDTRVPELHDTLVMLRVLYGGTDAANNRRFGHSLAAVAKRELGVDLPKDEQASDWSQPILSLKQLEYAARDAIYTGKLADALLPRIDEAGLRKVYELERRVAYAVDAMERNDFAVNEAALQDFIDRTTARAEELKAELTAEWGINPGSSKQLSEKFGLEDRED